MCSASNCPRISNGALPPVDCVDCEEFMSSTIATCSPRICFAVSDVAFTLRFNSELSSISPLFFAIALICLEVGICPFLKFAKQVLIEALSTGAPFFDAKEVF